MRSHVREGADAAEAASDVLPLVEVVVDESVNRALAGAAVRQLRLLVSVESLIPRDRSPGTSTSDGNFEDAVSAYVAENSPGYAHLDPEQAALALQVAVLEHFDVAMGDKAIAIFMHSAWTPELAAVHGAAAHPMNLRRWRADLRRRKKREPRVRRRRPAAPRPTT